jgi:hypothetical protein
MGRGKREKPFLCYLFVFFLGFCFGFSSSDALHTSFDSTFCIAVEALQKKHNLRFCTYWLPALESGWGPLSAKGTRGEEMNESVDTKLATMMLLPLPE